MGTFQPPEQDIILARDFFVANARIFLYIYVDI